MRGMTLSDSFWTMTGRSSTSPASGMTLTGVLHASLMQELISSLRINKINYILRSYLFLPTEHAQSVQIFKPVFRLVVAKRQRKFERACDYHSKFRPKMSACTKYRHFFA